jgi:hypothetical protein
VVLEKDEEISRNDHVREDEVLHRDKKEGNTPYNR